MATHAERRRFASWGSGARRLAEQRRERLGYVKALQNLVRLNGPEAAEAQELLQHMQRDSAAYAAMSRAFLR